MQDAGEPPHTMVGESAKGEETHRSGIRSTERERFLTHLRLAVTWENGSWHSGSLCFADTEEVTGSNPVAPTRYRRR
jgi:hypothetical protein